MADVFLLNGYRKGKFIFDIRQMFETKFFATHKYAFYMAKYSKKTPQTFGQANVSGSTFLRKRKADAAGLPGLDGHQFLKLCRIWCFKTHGFPRNRMIKAELESMQRQPP